MVNVTPNKELLPVEALQGTGWLLELTAEGRSMEPLVRAGSIVGVRCLPPREIRVGDVVCYKGTSGFVLHRIIEHDPETGRFLEKGDSVNRGEWIEPSSVLGVLEELDGEPFENRGADRAVRTGRLEQKLAEGLQRRSISIPSFLSRLWHRIKGLGGMR